MPIRIDNRGISTGEADARYLTLDQSTQQTVTGGIPLFATGMAVGNVSSYLLMSGNSIQLWVNGVKRQEWTTTPAPTSYGGIPIGILAAVTYPE